MLRAAADALLWQRAVVGAPLCWRSATSALLCQRAADGVLLLCQRAAAAAPLCWRAAASALLCQQVAVGALLPLSRVGLRLAALASVRLRTPPFCRVGLFGCVGLRLSVQAPFGRAGLRSSMLLAALAHSTALARSAALAPFGCAGLRLTPVPVCFAVMKSAPMRVASETLGDNFVSAPNCRWKSYRVGRLSAAVASCWIASLSVTLLAARLSVIICQSDGLCRAGRPAKSCVVIQDALPSPAVCLNLLRLHCPRSCVRRARMRRARARCSVRLPGVRGESRILLVSARINSAGTKFSIRRNKFPWYPVGNSYMYKRLVSKL